MTHQAFLILPLACLLAIAGCSDETSSGGESQADSDLIQKKVAAIVTLRDKIRDGFTSDDVDAAHGPLHEVGDQLDKLSKLIAESNKSDKNKQEIEDHINTLFAAFGEIDKTLHGREGSTWEEESSTINETMKKLVRICKTNNEHR